MQWFATVPFGMNTAGMAAWYFQGGGRKLWEETYAPFNLAPRPGLSTGPQMAGWFQRKINTIADYKGLKMRIPGLGGKVVARAGGAVVLTPGSEIYAALERGVVDRDRPAPRGRRSRHLAVHHAGAEGLPVRWTARLALPERKPQR